MNETRLDGKRILLTQSNVVMGPVFRDVLTEQGATVICDERLLDDPALPAEVVRAAGRVDVLVAHLGIPAPSTPVVDVDDDEWRRAFAAMVDPLPRLAAAVLPQMIERRSGKILVVGSASALRGMKRASTYSAARGAQLAWAQAVGVEMAPHGIQVNAIAQNLVDNPTYFPPEIQAKPAFQERIKREMPLGRLVSAREDACFAAYLCSDAANCFVGQVFPVCGGWVPR
ncbi:MAG: short-chain dehydrogenase [Polyangiaceae bacterium UTPRO1]|jgi:NAD(P)-dependent dehydrogenase (short-subunit alcohol dehydrogenase family)|nr:SDR family oxidoreductase [Myxococcales bacterium]OQY66248.1 MAG: short-chain dehydrogenase [Polyangiaceae bacterium UTPRO1]